MTRHTERIERKMKKKREGAKSRERKT